MEEKEEFMNVEDLDKYLDEQMKKANESLEESTPEEPAEEPKEEIDEQVEDEVSEEESEEATEEHTESKPKRSKEEKAEFAFAKLRKEASEAKKAYEERDALITRLMKEAGYNSYDEFKTAIDQQLNQKEMKEKGYTENQYKELEETRKRVKELEEQVASVSKRDYVERAKHFDSLVNEYAKQSNTKAKEIYDELQSMGYSVETLLAQPKPEILLKGLLADKIKPAKEVVKKTVDTEKLPSGDAKKEEFDIDELLKKELAEYKKRKGLA